MRNAKLADILLVEDNEGISNLRAKLLKRRSSAITCILFRMAMRRSIFFSNVTGTSKPARLT